MVWNKSRKRLHFFLRYVRIFTKPILYSSLCLSQRQQSRCFMYKIHMRTCLLEAGIKSRNKWFQPTATVRCNYLSLSLVHASGMFLILFATICHTRTKTRFIMPGWRLVSRFLWDFVEFNWLADPSFDYSAWYLIDLFHIWHIYWSCRTNESCW